MERAAAVLPLAQLGVYLVLGVVALVRYHRRRSRPAAYLAIAFSVLGVGLLVGRLSARLPPAEHAALQLVVIAAILAAPWLFAAFAWSFDGPLPRWLRATSAAVVLTTAWGAAITPLSPAAADRVTREVGFLVAFTVTWTLLAGAAAWRLWRAGGEAPPIRGRMRLLATGVVLINVALIVGLVLGRALPAAAITTTMVGIVAGVVAMLGLVPPLPLRIWWRRRLQSAYQQMQQDLIAASTPTTAARAVAAVLSQVIGGGVAVVARDGTVLAADGLDPEVARAAIASEPVPPATRRERAARGEGIHVVPVADARMVVTTTAYTVFDDHERELVQAYGWQLHLALQRLALVASQLAAVADAEQARQELESMLVGLSHDLRSPAVAIAGYAELLQDESDPQQRREMLAGIAGSSAYLNQLVDALLELRRVGRASARAEVVDLRAVAEVVRKRTTVTHPLASVQVQGDLPPVRMDPLQAEQVLDNLVGNALKHGGRGDITVVVDLRRVDDHLEVVVQDDGHGVRPEDRERIFGLFQRGRDAGASGSGVGLGLVRRIAEQLGGSLRLAPSTAGARFVLRLPDRLEAAVADPGEHQRLDPVGGQRAPATDPARAGSQETAFG